MATSKKIRRDDFVKSLRPDPKSIEPLVLLQGYIGDSDLDGHVRVYSDPALSEYIDVPEQEILYSESVKSEEDPLGGSRIWLRKTAVFTTGDPKYANRVKASFLEGDLMQAYANLGVNAATQAAIPATQIVAPVTRFCVTFNQASCFRTCFRTCLQVSCFRTCLNPSCFVTCTRTCNFTCHIPWCTMQVKPTIVEPNCGGTIVYQAPNQPSLACPTETFPTPTTILAANPAAIYTGGFNPYQTLGY